MKGMKFYLEYDSPFLKKRNHPNGNVVIIPDICILDEKTGYIIDAKRFQPGGTTHIAQSLNYLKTHCRRISAEKARTLHPALFERIEKGRNEYRRI